MAGADRSDGDRGDAWTGDASSPAVVAAEVDSVGGEVDLGSSETAPPDRDQLTIGLRSPDEAEGGDQPVDLAVVLPAAGGHLAGGAVDPPAAPSDPASGHLAGLCLPCGEASLGVPQGISPGCRTTPTSR